MKNEPGGFEPWVAAMTDSSLNHSATEAELLFSRKKVGYNLLDHGNFQILSINFIFILWFRKCLKSLGHGLDIRIHFLSIGF